MTIPVTALLLAGRRPGIDPLASHYGVDDKALIPVAGEPMLSRSARALTDHPRIARVIILSQSGDALAAHPQTAWLADHPKVAFEQAGGSVSGAVQQAIEGHSGDYPFVVATADDALLDNAKLDAFLAGVGDADLAFSLVERRTLLAAYPGSRRTWLRFRSGAYSGANLFWLASPAVQPLLDLWRSIEQQRKKGRAIIGAFGPLILLAVSLRLLTLDRAVTIAGRRFGVRTKAVVLAIPEACIDVDKPDDLVLVEEILRRRRS